MRTRESIAWAAGFYEGEGWIVASKPASYPIIGISQNEQEPLVRFHHSLDLGGQQERHRTSGFHRKGINTYRLSGFTKVQAAVAMMWPWLSERRRAQARKALTAYQQAWLHRAWVCPRNHAKQITAAGRRRCRPCEQEARR